MSSDADIQALREFLGADAERWTDAELQAAIDTAKQWIGGRRWSWKAVATNVLRDGRPHA